MLNVQVGKSAGLSLRAQWERVTALLPSTVSYELGLQGRGKKEAGLTALKVFRSLKQMELLEVRVFNVGGQAVGL